MRATGYDAGPDLADGGVMLLALRGPAVALFAVSLACSCTAGDDSGCAGPTEYDCVPSWCGGDVVSARVCSDGSWVCPEGQVPMDQCPDDACFHPPVVWCCDALGAATKPTCPGQAAEVCPPGTFTNVTAGSKCPPAGTFSCGSEVTCKLGQEYCSRMIDGAATTWSCEPLPAACVADATCACLAPECAGTCADFGIGALKCVD